MSEETRQTIEQWRGQFGAGKTFCEQDLWRERVARGVHLAAERASIWLGCLTRRCSWWG